MREGNRTLVTSYRRRALWAVAGLTLASVGLGQFGDRAHAQDSGHAKSAKSSSGKKKTAAARAKSAKGKTPSRSAPTARHGMPFPGGGPFPGGPPPNPRMRFILPGGPGGRMQLPPGAPPGGRLPLPAGGRAQGPPITIAPPESPPGGPGGPGFVPGGPSAGTTFAFDFRGTEITNVLKLFSQTSGLTFAVDKDLSGPVTIICPKQVTLDEAFKILQSVLSVRGFTALQDGNVVTVMPFDHAITSTPLLNSDPDNQKGIDPRNQVMTQVIPLQNVDAESLAKELAPLISKGASLIGSPGTNSLILTDQASNVARFLELVDALDQVNNSSDMKVYALKRAEASAIADIINNLYKQLTTRGRGGGAAQPGQPNFQPQQPGQQAQSNGRPAVIAVADPRTNSVIVVASPENQDKIASTIIGRLDDDDSNTMDTKVRKIRFSNAVTVANLVNTVLSNMHGSASSASNNGGSPFQNRAFGNFFGGGQQNNDTASVSSSDPFGKVAADPRTNTVLITASPDRMAKINELIDKIDVDVPAETTTFVIQLKNAQADDVAYALSQAFATANQNGLGNFNSFNIFGGGNGQSGGRQKINRRLGGNSNNPLGRSPHFANGTPPGPPNAPDGGEQGDGSTGSGDASATPQGVQGIMTPNGFVPNQDTSKSGANAADSRQFFFGGRQNGIGQSNGPQYGRGRNGGYANLLQLQNNVYVQASPNGDSIIVTTTPDNIKAVQDIVDALDVVQRQVMIEVIIAEVTLDQDEKLGFALNTKFTSLFGGQNPATGTANLPAAGFTNTYDPTATGAQFSVTADKYNLLLQALTSDDKVRILSTPRVFTTNNQEAEIDITQNVPYITSQNSGFFGGSNVSNQVQYLKVGFILDVTPRITRNGLVTIDVTQEASNLIRYQTLGTGQYALTAPVVNDRYADTSVTAQDGETIVVGGLMQDSSSNNINKVPVLSDIPFIGQFFRSREKAHSKVELMLFLTPHVVNNVDEARALAAKHNAMLLPDLPNLPKETNLGKKANVKLPTPETKGIKIKKAPGNPDAAPSDGQ